MIKESNYGNVVMIYKKSGELSLLFHQFFQIWIGCVLDRFSYQILQLNCKSKDYLYLLFGYQKMSDWISSAIWPQLWF